MGQVMTNLKSLDHLQSKSHTILPRASDRALRLDQVQLAQEFADEVCSGRLSQIKEVLEQRQSGAIHSVEALFKIREIVNRKD